MTKLRGVGHFGKVHVREEGEHEEKGEKVAGAMDVGEHGTRKEAWTVPGRGSLTDLYVAVPHRSQSTNDCAAVVDRLHG